MVKMSRLIQMLAVALFLIAAFWHALNSIPVDLIALGLAALTIGVLVKDAGH